MATKHISFNLRMLMAKKGVKTITDVAEGAGISRQTLTRIDNNTSRRLDLDTLGKLCTYFDCKPNDIFSITDQLTLLD